MECMFLSRFADERSSAAAIHWLDDDWTVATELGMLGRVFMFAGDQETKPCQFHAILDEWRAR